VGFAAMVQLTSSSTLVQLLTPNHLRGRVMAIHATMYLGAAPVGALLYGAVSTRLGAPTTVAIGGAICASAAFAVSGHHFDAETPGVVTASSTMSPS
jgi:hypothetical protein